MPYDAHLQRWIGRRALLGALATAPFARAGFAQVYPAHAIKLVVPQGPGGPTDIFARAIGQRLQSALGQSVVIENRAGAGGAIAAKAVAAAEPDGYTLFLATTSTMVIIPTLSRNAGYDGTRNFAPVAKLAELSQVLITHPSVPARSVNELVAYARTNPRKLNYASAGVGNIVHLAGELLKARADIDIVHVPYNSGAEVLTAVLGGQVQMCFININGLPPLIAEGRLLAHAVTSPARSPELPAVPTMIESGFPDFVVRAFFGVVAPAGTPAPIVERLNAIINATVASADLRTTFVNLGAEIEPGSPADFAASIVTERRRWERVASVANIRLD
jgi:tripartite-type tricarboxylate transporter receptor subunit TctC